MPNVVTAAATIGLTVTVLDLVLRREAANRMRPWFDRLMGDMRYELRNFAQAAAIDYAGTHLRSFKPLPVDVLAFLDFWLAEKDKQDASQAPIDEPERHIPVVLRSAFEFADRLRGLRERDREAMTPDIVRAIDDFWHAAGHGHLFLGFSRAELRDRPAEVVRTAEETVVRGARAFGEVLLRHDPRGRIVFDDLTLRAMAEHSRGLLARERWWRSPQTS